jgi:orotate phosphoribosyltransferase
MNSVLQTAKQDLIDFIASRMAERENHPVVTLATGEQTRVYLDPKNLWRDGLGLSVLQRALREHLSDNGLDDVTAIGGPEMGALPIAVAAATDFYRTNKTGKSLKWFAVRDHAKTDHGLGKIIEGAELGPDDKVIIVDDVADSGKSLWDSFQRIVLETHAQVIAVVPVVDRSDKAAKLFEDTPYLPILTYRDLGIEAL